MTSDSRLPNWPDWLDDVFTGEGIRLLNLAYDLTKRTGHLQRSGRLSAEDLATAAVGCWLAAGRTDLLLRSP